MLNLDLKLIQIDVIIFRGMHMVSLLDYGIVRMLALGRAEIFVTISSQLFLDETTKDKS